MSSVVYREVEAKSALNAVKGMPFDWSLNPYVGCPHACRYCFARAYNARYRDRDVGDAFDKNVEIKSNFVERLRVDLGRNPQGSVAIGTATDPYQPIEGKYQLTRRCLDAPVLCMPVRPGISDSEESLDAAARAASEAGATAFRHRPLKIDAEIQQYYYDFLATEFPVMVPRYAALYRGSAYPTKDYERELE